jgi:hypothetical protein
MNELLFDTKNISSVDYFSGENVSRSYTVNGLSNLVPVRYRFMRK